MSVSVLSEVFPVSPEQLPTASIVMAEDLRLGAFRTVCSRLLKAMVVINEAQYVPAGWCQLDGGSSSSAKSHSVKLFNTDQRIGIATTVVTDKLPAKTQIVTSGLHLFGGENELTIIKVDGQDEVKHQGATAAMYIRGVLGGDGNPNFGRDEIDCEPEMQSLSLGVEGYIGSPVMGIFDGDKRYKIPMPNQMNYAFYDSPPQGDQAIVTLSEHVADFLEAVA